MQTKCVTFRYTGTIFQPIKTKQIMTKRLKYEKPSMKVVLLTQRSMLLAGSPLGNPDNYPGQPDPFNF